MRWFLLFFVSIVLKFNSKRKELGTATIELPPLKGNAFFLWVNVFWPLFVAEVFKSSLSDVF